MKSVFLFLIFLLLSGPLFATQADSLFAQGKEMEPEERMKFYNVEAFKLINLDPASAVQVANAAMMEGQQLKNKAAIGQALYTMAYAQRKVGLSPYSLNHAIEGADQYYLIGDSAMATRCMVIAGLNYFDIGFERTSGRIFKNAKAYYDKIGDRMESARMALYLSKAYNTFQGQMLSAPLLVDAIKVFDSLDRKDLGLESKHLLAQTYDFMDSVSRAEELFVGALSQAESTGAMHLQIPIGLDYSMFLKKNARNNATEIASKYLDLARKDGRRRLVRAAIDTTVIHLIAEGLNEKAVQLLKESISLAELDGCDECLQWEYKMLAEAQFGLGKFKDAYASMQSFQEYNSAVQSKALEKMKSTTREGFYADNKEDELSYEREKLFYANQEGDAVAGNKQSFIQQNARLLIFGAFLLISLALVNLLKRPKKKNSNAAAGSEE